MKHTWILAMAVMFAACDSSKEEQPQGKEQPPAKTGEETSSTESALAPLNEDVKVTPLNINESRYAQLDKSEQNLMGMGGLNIEVRLQGQAVAQATKVGNVKITKAVDNLGNSLARESHSGFRDGMDVIDRDSRFGPERADDETQVSLSLKPSARAAMQIALLEGTVTLSVTKVAKVEISGKDLNNLIGKKIESPVLENAGISVEVLKMNSGGSLITMKVVDKKELLSEMDVIGPDGESLKQGHSSGGFGGVSTTELFGSGRISDDAKLVLSVETDRQDREVPFKLENLPLP